MLNDMAVQALPPAGNAPSTVYQVILRLTNLMLKLARHPQHSGVFCDHERQVRLLHPKTTWEEYVELCFFLIGHYGKDEPVARESLETAFDLLLERLPEPRRPPVQRQKDLLFS
jgi:uncharacterized membrane protein